MASPFDATLILCDAAIVDSNGKISMLGAGWSVTGSPTAPQSVAVMIKVPWDRTNQKFKVQLQLTDPDGKAIQISAPTGGLAPVGAEAEMEAGRPPGLPHGVAINAAFALSVGPMSLPPGRYDWRLSINSDMVGSEPFTVLG